MKSNKIHLKTFGLMAIGGLIVVGLLSSFSPARKGSHHISKTLGEIMTSDPVVLLKKYGLSAEVDLVDEDAIRMLESCGNKFIELKKFSMDVEYSVYYNSEDFAHPADKRSGKIVRDKDNFFQEEMGNIRLINKDCELILNKNSEFITVRDRIERTPDPVHFTTDSLKNVIVRTQEIKDGYCYYFKEGTVEKMEIITDSEGYLKIWRTWYRKPMDFGEGEVRVVTQMEYKNLDKKPKTDPYLFSTDPYVTISRKGEVKPVGAYQNYYILNQLTNL